MAGSLSAPACCQNYWGTGMNERHNEWKLSHLLSLAVCKLSVNQRLGTDAAINDVFSVLSALVALSRASSLQPFIISITEKWESYGERGGSWTKKKREIQRKEEACLDKAGAPTDWLMSTPGTEEGQKGQWDCSLDLCVHDAHARARSTRVLFVRCNLFAGPRREPSAASAVLKSEPHKRTATHSLLRPLICMTKACLII